MTCEDRVRALAPWGFTPRQTRFLVTVALHGGYCLRRQYATFAGIQYGKNVCDFLEALVERHIAARVTFRADRGHVYHLQARALYRALEQADNRNRRRASAALIARKIMVLDYVLAHPEVDWIATEQDKVALFTEHYRIPVADLPQRVFQASRPGVPDTTRYFIHKLPVGVTPEPGGVSFVCLVTDTTGGALKAFLADHGRLFTRMPGWTVVAIGSHSAALASCEAVFARCREQPVAVSAAPSWQDLRWLVATRPLVDRGEWARLSVADIDRFRTLRDRCGAAVFDDLYAQWCAEGDAALGALAPVDHGGPARSVGRLVTARLPFDYSQFGSWPGVA